MASYSSFLLIILTALTISSPSNSTNLRSLSHDNTLLPTPTIVTVPATTTTTNPAATTPLPVTTTYPPPSSITNTPLPPSSSSTGQSWCVAKTGASETALQSALDYACGVGGADCSTIQQGGSCYNPNSLQNHASFAFNSYYQKNPAPTSCDFGGTAALVNNNPSSGTCVYPSSSSTSSSGSQPPPATTTPTTTTPPATPTITTTPPVNPTTVTPTPTVFPPPSTTTTVSPDSGTSGTVSPPSVLNASNPASGFGSDIPPVSNSTADFSSAWQHLVSCFNLVASYVIGSIILVM